jgi:uncharacterized peroxidase-related enzyme
MAYIKLDNEMPGIVALLWSKPKTGKILSKLAHTLLKGPSSLSSGEREMIAAYVSSLNDTCFCNNSHSAAAVYHFKGNEDLINAVKKDPGSAPVSEKMKKLLVIAGKIKESGRAVNSEDFNAARKAGATDDELHETVLIASAFCMYNRYVDGLGTSEPEDKEDYKDMGKRMATIGYKTPPFLIRKLILWKEAKKKEKSKR